MSITFSNIKYMGLIENYFWCIDKSGDIEVTAKFGWQGRETKLDLRAS